MKQREIVFLDTETTGLDSLRAEVIEFAAVKVYPDGTEEALYFLIRPERIEDAEPKALEVNGYAKAPERWATAPTMADVGDQIAEFLRGTVLCGHNVSFDEAMLNANLQRSGIKKRVPYHKVDTTALAYEHLVPLGLPGLSLDKIRDFLDWDKEGAHTAMKDVRDTQRLYNLLARMNWWGRLKIRALRFWLAIRD